MKTLNPKYKAVIDRIQKSIPDYLLKGVLVKKKVAPEVVDLLKKGVVDTEFSEETRQKWQLVLDSGYLDKEIDQEVPEISEEIDAYVELEMSKAVIRKELPKPKHKRPPYEQLLVRYNKIKEENDKKFNRN